MLQLLAPYNEDNRAFKGIEKKWSNRFYFIIKYFNFVSSYATGCSKISVGKRNKRHKDKQVNLLNNENLATS